MHLKFISGRANWSGWDAELIRFYLFIYFLCVFLFVLFTVCIQFVRRCKCMLWMYWINWRDKRKKKTIVCVYPTSVAHLLNGIRCGSAGCKIDRERTSLLKLSLYVVGIGFFFFVYCVYKFCVLLLLRCVLVLCVCVWVSDWVCILSFNIALKKCFPMA